MDITFIGNTVTKNGTGGGIWGSRGQQITITNNFVEECGDVCIDAEGGTDFTIKDNKVHNGKNGGITTFYAASHAIIDHNTIVQDAGYDSAVKIYGIGTCQYLKIINNIITTNGSDGILTYHDTMANSTVTGNDITLIGEGTGINVDGGSGNTLSPNCVGRRGQ